MLIEIKKSHFKIYNNFVFDILPELHWESLTNLANKEVHKDSDLKLKTVDLDKFLHFFEIFNRLNQINLNFI